MQWQQALYEIIGTAIDDKYIAQVKAQVVNQDAIDRHAESASRSFTHRFTARAISRHAV